MKIFLELEKPQSEEEMKAGYPPQTMRYEVGSKDEALELLEKLRETGMFAGWRARLHYCYQAERQPCRLEDLGEV